MSASVAVGGRRAPVVNQSIATVLPGSTTCVTLTLCFEASLAVAAMKMARSREVQFWETITLLLKTDASVEVQ